MNDVAAQEVEALSAIFGPDFSKAPIKTAWNVGPPEYEYILRLDPYGDEYRGSVSVFLSFRYTKKYPEQIPNLTIKKDKGLSESQLESLQFNIIEQATNLKGQEMLYDIANYIQEWISEHNCVITGNETSFFDLMKDRQEALNQEEKRKQEKLEQERQRLQALELEHQQAELAKQIEEEIQRKEGILKEQQERRRKIPLSTPIKVNRNALGMHISEYSFDSVLIGQMIRSRGSAQVFQAKSLDTPLLVHKETIHYPSSKEVMMNHEIQRFKESFLAMSYGSIASLFPAYDLRISQQGTKVEVDILLADLATTTISDILTTVSLGMRSVQKYLMKLLQILNEMHSQNYVHGEIRSEYLHILSDGSLQLAGAEFASSLANLRRLSTEKKRQNDIWILPESVTRSHCSAKSDIWQAGFVLLHMILSDSIFQYDNLRDCLSKEIHLPFQIVFLVTSMMAENPEERPSAREILQNRFFVEDPYVFLSPVGMKRIGSLESSMEHRIAAAPTNPATTPSKLSQAIEVSTSRYLTDFEELGFLGKGGFGSVVKARNRIDGRFYAIKKIRINRAKDREESVRLLREVQTLSRLHNQFVVRYYQAWFEDGFAEAEDTDDGESYSDTTDSTESDEAEEESSGEYGSTDETDESVVEFGDASNDWLASHEPSASGRYGSGLVRSMSNQSGISIAFVTEELDSPDAEMVPIRTFYIQMEFCENKTLREVIDGGVLNVDDSWRYLRQILEGLAHIHSQGMIHRDLKPANIFLDARGMVKIGDFGLATEKSKASTKQLFVTQGGGAGADISLTSDVGTPVYIAPEILLRNAKYNTKVDMYSLGITFFEMIYEMKTGMQRLTTLTSLRLPEIKFPLDFNRTEMKAQVTIIRQLLNHTPRERPSCLELLRSPLVPTRVEEEYINEELLRVVRQNNPSYFARLISSIFSQTTDKHKDFAYDFNSNSGAFDVFTGVITRTFLQEVFKTLSHHGAIFMSSPLLIPKSEDTLKVYETRLPAEMLDSTGTVVQIPHDLTVPFARSVARATAEQVLFPLKRFTVDRVFRRNLAGGQPKAVMECDFDIITFDELEMLSEAEVIKAALEVVDITHNASSSMEQYIVLLNDARLLNKIIDLICSSRTQQDQFLKFLEHIRWPISPRELKTKLKDFGLPQTSLELLDSLVPEIDLADDEAVEAFSSKFFDIPALKDLRTLQMTLLAIKACSKVVYIPLLVHNPNVFGCGCTFQIVRVERKRYDVLAAGGRYDNLLRTFRGPFERMTTTPKAVGVNIGISKLIAQAVEAHEDEYRKHGRIESNSLNGNAAVFRADVLVIAFGAAGTGLERIKIANDLWSAGISAELSLQDAQLDLQWAMRLGYKYAVILKQRGSDPSLPFVIKVKNMVTRAEIEVPRNELVTHLMNELAYTSKVKKVDIQPHSEISSTPTSLPSNVTIVPMAATPKKGRLRHNKATSSYNALQQSAIDSTLSSSSSAPIIIVEMTETEIQRLRPFWGMDETAFKRGIAELHLSLSKEHVMQVRRQVSKAKGESKHGLIFLFSSVDNMSIPIMI